MKNILCFGDSNTWGYVPGAGNRYPKQIRWTGILQNLLGNTSFIIEEGLNGRTTVLDDPTRIAKNGLTYLIPCLSSHAPIDLVLMMLGTNDCKHRFGLSAFDISEGVAMLVSTILQSGAGINGKAPQILLVSPPLIMPAPSKMDLFFGAEEKSKQLAYHVQQVANNTASSFIDAANHCSVSAIDGIHLDEAGHLALGQVLAEKINSMGL